MLCLFFENTPVAARNKLNEKHQRAMGLDKKKRHMGEMVQRARNEGGGQLRSADGLAATSLEEDIVGDLRTRIRRDSAFFSGVRLLRGSLSSLI